MTRLLPLLLVVAFPAGGRADDVDFNRDVRPILADKCFACHGPDAKQRKADLRLDAEKDAKAGGVIVPGKPGESALVARITPADAAVKMPPPKSGKTLTAAEVDTLKRWVAQGAKWAPRWAYVAPRRVPVPPEGHPLDHFITARLTHEGLALSPEADRRTLLCRLTFDLTGLPPTPAEVDDFFADRDPRAFEKRVDRLLASEHYGERMAVHWLDLVRYADTVGYHGDQDHHAKPYRDYVIDAFNDNLPFDRFTREQLAGDPLPNPTDDQKIATCYNRLLQTSHEGGVQPKEYLAIYQADRVRNLSAVWTGATVGCAQCHDHKFDTYTDKDFYALAAFFADVTRRSTSAAAGPTRCRRSGRPRCRCSRGASGSGSRPSTHESPNWRNSRRRTSGRSSDHHFKGFSMWLAGGGVKGGTSYGATDELGYHAAVNVAHVRDLHATVLHLLGIDHRRLAVTHQGLDVRLTGVEPAGC